MSILLPTSLPLGMLVSDSALLLENVSQQLTMSQMTTAWTQMVGMQMVKNDDSDFNCNKIPHCVTND